MLIGQVLGETGKHLALSQDARTSSQIFSCPALPLSQYAHITLILFLLGRCCIYPVSNLKAAESFS